jgi:hypothetical protein
MAFAYRAQSSAYLSIYNDWDILREAIASIVPYVSEIVVVDGAYEWMTPYLDAIGQLHDRSEPRGLEVMREIAATHDVAVKTVRGVWSNEMEKRIAGYSACAGRFVFRIDADEIFQFDEAAVAQFFAEGWAIGEMEMPVCIAPGLILASDDGSRLPRQCFLFDREQISAARHLHYLWLVLGPEPLPEVEPRHIPIFPEPLAFNTHLTTWRTPATAVTRGAFYRLNYSRKHGHPTATTGDGERVTDLRILFSEHLDGQTYRDSLMASDFVVNLECGPSQIICAAPQTPDAAVLDKLYGQFLDGLAEMNRIAAQAGRAFGNGERVYLDISTPAARQALGTSGRIAFEVSSPPFAAKAQIEALHRSAPFRRTTELEPIIKDGRVHLEYDASSLAEGVIRQVLGVQIWCAPGHEMHRLRVRADAAA